jgi:hypothetical protein
MKHAGGMTTERRQQGDVSLRGRTLRWRLGRSLELCLHHLADVCFCALHEGAKDGVRMTTATMSPSPAELAGQ